jgi:lysophospholipase L1-like esterase
MPTSPAREPGTTVTSSYAAIGDSFTEGMGDERADGTPRGWADLVAVALAHAAGEPIGYANLAIRGRLLAPILDDQLPAAMALRPQLLSNNGGGNDILRPRVAIGAVADRLVSAALTARDAGIRTIVVSGGNPTRHLPLGATFEKRGDALADAVRTRLSGTGVVFVDNWFDTRLPQLDYWSVDRLHLNAHGHAIAASNVLAALEVPIPAADAAPDALEGEAGIERPRTAEYWRRYVLPWVGRRITGRSSGDSREPKRPHLDPVADGDL